MNQYKVPAPALPQTTSRHYNSKLWIKTGSAMAACPPCGWWAVGKARWMAGVLKYFVQCWSRIPYSMTRSLMVTRMTKAALYAHLKTLKPPSLSYFLCLIFALPGSNLLISASVCLTWRRTASTPRRSVSIHLWLILTLASNLSPFTLSVIPRKCP